MFPEELPCHHCVSGTSQSRKEFGQVICCQERCNVLVQKEASEWSLSMEVASESNQQGSASGIAAPISP